jgi:hypothetical protein
MAVKILIKRSIGQEVTPVIRPLIVELRAHAMKQSGYISGETLKCIDRPGEYLVISTWQSLDDWNKWLKWLQTDLFPRPRKVSGVLAGASRK